MYKYFKLSLILIICVFNVSIVSAAILDDQGGGMNNIVGNVAVGAGVNAETSMGDVVSLVISGFLGFMGIAFLIIMILAGYKWMNAEGNEEKVQEAKDSIRRAIIGLIILVSAYAITYFVFNSLDFFSGGNSSSSPRLHND